MEVDLDGHPGLLLRPASARYLYVLAHGAGAGMRHAFMIAIADALAEHGVATLRWEFPFMAAGKPRPDPAPVAEAAVRAVWTAARAQLSDLPMFAGGKSFGGRMTSRAHAAAPLDGLRGLAFLGFPLHPPDKRGGPAPTREALGPANEQLDRSRDRSIPEGVVAPRLRTDAGSKRTPSSRLARGSARSRSSIDLFIRGPLAGAARRTERAAHLVDAKGPLLFVQGTRDALADLTRLRPVVQNLGVRAKLHIVDHADHGFDVLVRSGRRSDQVLAEIATTVATWMDAVARGTKPRRR